MTSFLLLVLSLVFGKVLSDAFDGINVGYDSGVADVIASGVTGTRFSNNDLVSLQARYFVEGDVDSVTFYGWTTSQSKILLQKPAILVDSPNGVGSTAKLVNWPKILQKVPALVTPELVASNGTDLPITIQFECLSVGSSKVQVNMRFLEMAAVRKTHKLVSFQFYKKCTHAETGVQGTVLNGFHVGSSPSLSDIVHNGEATPGWEIRTEGDVVEATINEDTVKAIFWVRYNSKRGIKMSRANVILDNPAILSAVLIGKLTRETSMVTKRAASLTVQFNCFKRGESKVTVALKSPADNDVNIIWSFNKRCDGPEMAEGVAIQGLNMGTEPGLSDVIVDGITTDGFRNAFSGDEEQTKIMMVYGQDIDKVKFYLTSSAATVSLKHPALVIARTLSLRGQHVAIPTVSGSLTRANTIGPDQVLEVILDFNCQRDGSSDISVEIPLKPSGALQFVVEKVCKVGKNFVPINEHDLSKIPGLNVGSVRGAANIIKDGLPQSSWHWENDVRDLRMVPANKPFISFFATKNKSMVDAHDIRLGAPEIISTIRIAQPEISGRGSEGGIVTTAGDYASVTITFHCVSNGTAQFDVVIPVLPLTIDEVALRDDPIKITFLKKCLINGEQEMVSGMGGVAINGFSVGSSVTGTDVVLNGFPQKLYYGQRNKPVPAWSPIIVPAGKTSSVFYLHFNTRSGVTPGALGSAVEFQAPVVVTHGHECKPTISGNAAVGGFLKLNADPLELDITWNCRFAGLGTATVTIPIVPHGTISFTVPKTCTGTSRPQGERISGLFVGSTKNKKDVVNNGLTMQSFQPYKAHELGSFTVFEAESEFWFWSEERDLGALEPVVFAYRPIANPKITHNLHVDKGDDKWERQVSISIGKEPKPIKITYNCVVVGETAVSMIIPILPKGNQVAFTWTLVCGGDDYDFGVSSFNYFDDYVDHYSEDDYYTKGPGDDTYSSSNDLDYYYYYDDYYSLGSAGGTDYFYNDWETFDEKNWNPFIDELVLYSKYSPLGWLNVGTDIDEASRNDVVDAGQATSQYAMIFKANDEEEGVPTEEELGSQYTVVSRNKESSTFYISVPSKYQTFGFPIARAQPGKKGADICVPQLLGPASIGGNATNNGDPIPLELVYNCLRPGVTPVHISIPLMPGFVSFRVIKVCSNYQKRVEWYWTASRIMIMGMMVVGFVASIYAYRMLKATPAPTRAANTVPITTYDVDVDTDSSDDD